LGVAPGLPPRRWLIDAEDIVHLPAGRAGRLCAWSLRQRFKPVRQLFGCHAWPAGVRDHRL